MVSIVSEIYRTWRRKKNNASYTSSHPYQQNNLQDQGHPKRPQAHEGIPVLRDWSPVGWDPVGYDQSGFVTGHDPEFFNQSQAASKLNAHLHSKLLEKKIKIPRFRFVFTSLQVRHSTQIVSTKAFAVKVLSEDSALMLQVLQTLVNATPEFVPNTLNRKYPDGYENST